MTTFAGMLVAGLTGAIVAAVLRRLLGWDREL